MPQFVPVTPPVALLAPTAIPDFTGMTNGDLVEYIDTLRAAVAECNADKAATAHWADETSKEPPR